MTWMRFPFFVRRLYALYHQVRITLLVGEWPPIGWRR